MAEIETNTAAVERELKLIGERDALATRLPAAEIMVTAPERAGMIRVAHSPAPWRRDTGKHGHLIRDALGDSIAALALATGDHPAAEQLANADLMSAAPLLLRVVDTTLELHAGGCIRLPDGLLQEMLQLQQTARGGL